MTPEFTLDNVRIFTKGYKPKEQNMTKCTKTAAGLTTARAFVAFSVSADAGHTGGAGHLGGFGGFRGDGGHAAFVGHAGPNISLANLDMDITVAGSDFIRHMVFTMGTMMIPTTMTHTASGIAVASVAIPAN